MDIELTQSDLSSMNYTPLPSVDIERSFSRYKSILRPDRRTFKFENLQVYVLSNCLQEDNYKNE